MPKYYLSEVITNTDRCVCNKLNFINAPTGAGKTTFVKDVIAKETHSILYLIDTSSMKNTLINSGDYIPYSRAEVDNLTTKWLFGDCMNTKGMVMTYAAFGYQLKSLKIAMEYIDKFDYIICDEIHNLYSFANFSIGKKGHRSPELVAVKEWLQTQIEIGKHTKVIGMTATPRDLYKLFPSEIILPIITNDEFNSLNKLITQQEATFNHIDNFIPNIELGQRGIIYTGHITKIKWLQEQLESKGHKAIGIWSLNNTDHEMSEEQKSVIDYIQENAAFPDNYDILLINAGYQTGISINNQLDFMAIDSRDEVVITQVRGRNRNTLPVMYIIQSDTREEQKSIIDKFVGIEMDVREREQLINELAIKKQNRELVGWRTIQDMLVQLGYKVTSKRKQKNGVKTTFITISK